jgi:hypothetical protein
MTATIGSRDPRGIGLRMQLSRRVILGMYAPGSPG